MGGVSGPFDVILADPPWSYYGDPNKNAAAGKHYPLMTQEELAALNVREVMSKRAALFLWATCPRLDFAVDLIRAWGLHFRGVAWVWIKTRKDGGIITGQGVPPTLVKPTMELVLAATTNKRGRPFPILTSKQSQYIFAPRGKHSEKPTEVHDRIEELVGDRPRLEIFARRERPGWVTWGNEVP